MRVVMFCHSLLSDWNHGNAHFLRGVVTALQARGHEVRCYEPSDAWSLQHLLRECGTFAIEALRVRYPRLDPRRYDPAQPDYDQMLDGAELVLVHEWNTPQLVAEIGERRARTRGFRLLFHDSHHRAVSAPHELARLDLRHYDGALVFGAVLREQYLERGWIQRAWVWHEAADVRVFYPHEGRTEPADLVWIGNWGDGERSAELREFLLRPIEVLRLRAHIYGVRYPEDALVEVVSAGAAYRGFLQNFEVPQTFAEHRVTVHVPRRYYARALPGIPTIRVFEALACGIPLVSAPWRDCEQLFTPGADYLVADTGADMTQHLRDILHDRQLAQALRAHGLETIRQRHTCEHRVAELEGIYRQLEDE